MTNKLKSSLHKAALTTGLLAGIILTNKDALAQNIASNGKSTTQTEVTAKINKLNIDPFDRVKTFVDQSNPVEVEHYNRLLETELQQKESHILGLKVALLALHNDPTISAQDKKALALIVFEDGVNLPPGTPNRNFYSKKHQQRLENDETFFDLCIKFGEMQGNLMAEISSKKLTETLKEGKQLDEKGKQLDEKLKQLDEKGKQLDEKGKQLDEEGKQLDEEIVKGKEEIAKLDKQIELMQQILQAYESKNK